jgi:hypothetical protein
MILLLFLAIGVFAQSSHYLFEPSFGIRTYSGNNAIITSFETTLLPGAPTDPSTTEVGDVAWARYYKWRFDSVHYSFLQ